MGFDQNGFKTGVKSLTIPANQCQFSEIQNPYSNINMSPFLASVIMSAKHFSENIHYSLNGITVQRFCPHFLKFLDFFKLRFFRFKM